MRDEFERWCEERFRVGSSQLCMLEGRELREAWTAAESRGIVKGRIEGMREAASKVWAMLKDERVDYTVNDVYDAIKAIIDQPQEDVCCEWEKYTRSSSGWLYTTSCGSILAPVSGATCICGKPIKVTHGDKV